jgi:hypothetical protein
VRQETKLRRLFANALLKLTRAQAVWQPPRGFEGFGYSLELGFVTAHVLHVHL